MKEADLIQALKNRYSERRLLHSLGVANTAEKLASQTGVVASKARQAGLLHDYAKGLGSDELCNIASLIKEWDIDELELAIPRVLHAPVSAYLVKDEFGITDIEILEAIRYHTIGNPGMGILAKIIFVADFIEPNRDFNEAIKVREVLEDGIDKAIINICNFVIKYNIDQGRLIHPNTVFLRNVYLREDVTGC